MVNCSVINCKNRSVLGGHTRFYSFPKDEAVANTWLKYCRPKTTLKNGRVCSKHFTESDKTLRHALLSDCPQNFPVHSRALKPDAVPSLFLDGLNPAQANANQIKDISFEDHNYSKCSFVDTKLANISEDSLLTANTNDSSFVNDNGSNSFEANKNALLRTSTFKVSRSAQTLTTSSSGMTSIPASEYKDLMETKNKYDTLLKNLHTIFSDAQIRCLLKPGKKKRVQWSTEDVIAAKTFRKISPKAYDYMRNTIGFPLPGHSTLCKWASKGIDVVHPEIEEYLIEIIEEKTD